MRLRTSQRALALLSAAVLASTLMLSGCGRSPAEAPGPEEPGIEEPGEEPGEEPFPDEPGGGTDPAPAPGGGGAEPAPAPGGGGPAPKPTKPALKPLPKVTPVPVYKDPKTSAPDPAAAKASFVELLRKFGYAPARKSEDDVIHDTRMQLLPLVRCENFRWAEGPEGKNVGLIFGRRKQAYPTPIAYDKWRDDALKLAARNDSVTYYVARAPLYREILSGDYYAPDPSQALTFYKRLNKTNLMVSFKADGTVMDYGFFPTIDWRDFLAVPDAFWR